MFVLIENMSFSEMINGYYRCSKQGSYTDLLLIGIYKIAPLLCPLLHNAYTEDVDGRNGWLQNIISFGRPSLLNNLSYWPQLHPSKWASIEVCRSICSGDMSWQRCRGFCHHFVRPSLLNKLSYWPHLRLIESFYRALLKWA